MPVKDYQCEFCDEVMRKDRIAKHVKDTHKVEIGKYLLDVYDGKLPDSKMNDFLGLYLTSQFKNVITIRPLYSDKYTEESEHYMFSIIPYFYTGTTHDDKEVSSYKNTTVNIEAHYNFIEECINTIPLGDFIRCQRKHVITSEENVEFLKQKRDLINTKNILQKQVEHLTCENENLRISEKKAIAKANECADVLDMGINEVIAMRTNNRSLLNENNRLRDNTIMYNNRLKELNEDFEIRFTTMNESKLKELDELYKENEELRKKYEKVENKIKKEAQKIVDKEKEKRRKEKEKERKKAKEAERKAAEAKLLAKLRKKNLKSKSYDSDTGDSDGSDSDTSDSDGSDSDTSDNSE
jgi:hypothetical protein